MLALERAPSGSARSWRRLGLIEPMRTEAGPMAPPQLPKHWGRIETITIAYGHGLAVAPLQFAAAMAALVNGGTKVTPTLLARAAEAGERPRLVSAATSAKHARDHAPQRDERRGHRPAAPRRRAIASAARPARPRCPGAAAISEKSVISSFVGRISHGCAEVRHVGAAVRAASPPRGRGEASPPASTLRPTTARIVERIAPAAGRPAAPAWACASPTPAV